jgi:peptide chain release factor 1
MFPSLQTKLQRYDELERLMQDPAVLADPTQLISLQREHGGLAKVGLRVREFNRLSAELADLQAMARDEADAETREYALAEVATLKPRLDELTAELEEMVLSGDSLTRASLIMEIRAGTGGEEAALFAGDLLGMYQRYADAQGWKVELIDLSNAEMGGIKEVVLSISGEGAYHRLRFESGGHRVQRVPETETQGRVHTSMATVAVLPEAGEVEVDIRDEDLQIDTMRAGGPGGQKVNKTESAVRITHIPSGLVVKCQDEKSQQKNKSSAMRVLRSRLLEKMEAEQHAAMASQRKLQVGSGDRSDRIRTYNFPQNRLTDHRIGLTVHKLDQIILGHMDEVIGELLRVDREERLQGPN